MLLQTGPVVRIFTAGDHFSGYEKPAEASSILELMLTRSGYTKEYEWECRVDKMKHCSTESRPVRIVGFKNYGIIMRVKPTVNATADYQMTLLVPQGSGYSAKNVFEQLKANEKSISRWIRQQEREKPMQKAEDVIISSVIALPTLPIPMPTPAPTPAPIEVAPIPQQEYRPVFLNLQRTIKDKDKLRYILMKVRAVEKLNFCHNKIQFAETLKHECKWDKEGQSSGAVSRVLTELVKNEYLSEVVRGSKITGYTLTDRANQFLIEDYAPPLTRRIEEEPPTTELITAKEPKVNISTLLVNFRDKLQELADVANRITKNNNQKFELLKKVEELDKENDELSKILDPNKESQDLLNKLGRLMTSMPLHGE